MFQSRGRDLLIGKAIALIEIMVGHVSVPWSGFINRKFGKVLFRKEGGEFQSRGRDLLIGNSCPIFNNGIGIKFQSRGRDLLIGKEVSAKLGQAMLVSVPWSGFINRNCGQREQSP